MLELKDLLNQTQLNKLIWDRSLARSKSKNYLMRRLEIQSQIKAQIDELNNKNNLTELENKDWGIYEKDK